MKKIISIILALVMALSLCACGGGGGRYKSIKTLGHQQYSIGFRLGDSTYHYIDAALRELGKKGTVDALSSKWFGSSSTVNMPSGGDKLKELGYIAPRSFIIGVDLDSYPMCFEADGGYTGFDVELAKAVCELLGWELRIQPIHSEDAYVELNSGNIDCAWGGVVLDTESTDYTILYTYMSTDIVVAGLTNSIKNKSLYMGTADTYMSLIEENKSLARRLSQITRVHGGATDYFAYLNSGECQLIITTAAAVEYANSH